MGFSPWVLPAPPCRGFDVTSNEVELDRHDPMLSLKKSAGGRRFSGVQFDVTLKGALGRPVQRAATPGDYTQMQSIAQTVPLVKADKSVLVGRGVSGLVVLFMLFDGVSKVVVEQHVVKAMTELGWPPEQTVGLGLLVIACTAVYVIPRTSVVGAILLTGFLGGATAAKVRIEDASACFSIAMGVLVWLGVLLRDARLRALLPLRR
jgi:hypothetical protein